MKGFIAHLAFQEAKATSRTWFASLCLSAVSSLLVLLSLSFIFFPSQARVENANTISVSTLEKFSGLGQISLIIYLAPAIAITVIVSKAVIARLRPRQAAIFLTGATPKQMGSVFRWQIVIVSVLGYIISLVLWVMCSPFVMSRICIYFGGESIRYHLGAPELLLSAVIIFLQTFMSAWITTRKFASTSPMDFLAQAQAEKKTTGPLRLTITVLSFGLLIGAAWAASKMIHDAVPSFASISSQNSNMLADVWSTFALVPALLTLPFIILLVAGGPIWNIWIIRLLHLASSFRRPASRWWMVATRQAERRLSTSSAAAMPLAIGFTLLFLLLMSNTIQKNVCAIYGCPHQPDSVGQFLIVFLPTAIVIFIGILAIVALTDQEQRYDTNAVQLAGLIPSDSYKISFCETLVLEVIIVFLSLVPTGLTLGFIHTLAASKGYDTRLVGINMPVVIVSYLASFVILLVLLSCQTRFSLRNPLYQKQE